jgi:hypothetical protein
MDGSGEWNISERCQLNLKSIKENFTLNQELLSKNEKNLSELFTLVENEY